MKNKSYTSTQTGKVQPWRAYEIDYKFNTGDFFEKKSIQNKLDLLYRIHVTRWVNNEGWNYSKHSGAYEINALYRNKNNVEVSFVAYSATEPVNQTSFLFMNKVAKKFYLNNKLGKSKLPLKPHLEWSVVEELISNTSENTSVGGLRDAFSWSKTMTVREAKELFGYLGINIIFPH